jgi:hypothetical protein
MYRNRCLRLEDQSAETLAEQLAADSAELTVEELLAVERFVEQIGGLENARLAVDMLAKLDRAA